MISITTALLLIVIHFFADFVCQTHDMAVNKSHSNSYLTAHVAVYTLVTLLAWNFCLFQPSMEYYINTYLMFVLFIFSTHWITDYVTSRISGRYFAKQDYHNGFVVVGIDQVLHYVQILTAYWLFIK